MDFTRVPCRIEGRVLLAILLLVLTGCSGKEDSPKESPHLPVVELPRGHLADGEKSLRVPIKEHVDVDAKFTIRGEIESRDRDGFQPRKVFLKFVHETKGRRITAGTEKLTLVPVEGKVHSFRYEQAVEAPGFPGEFLMEIIEINPEPIVLASALLNVIERKDN